LPVSVTPTPRRTRLKRLRAAKLPNSVHAPIAASGERNKRADVRIDAIGNGRKVARTAVAVDGRSPGQDRIHQADAESGHYRLAR
jgi:hypothetical protein